MHNREVGTLVLVGKAFGSASPREEQYTGTPPPVTVRGKNNRKVPFPSPMVWRKNADYLISSVRERTPYI